jgi:hypothetical protein
MSHYELKTTDFDKSWIDSQTYQPQTQEHPKIRSSNSFTQYEHIKVVLNICIIKYLLNFHPIQFYLLPHTSVPQHCNHLGIKYNNNKTRWGREKNYFPCKVSNKNMITLYLFTHLFFILLVPMRWKLCASCSQNYARYKQQGYRIRDVRKRVEKMEIFARYKKKWKWKKGE